MKDIEMIYTQYQPAVYKYVYAMCKDSLLAEEITQETFFQIISRCCVSSHFIPERFFRKRETVETQICRLAESLLGKEQRRRQTETCTEPAYFLSSDVPGADYLPEPDAVRRAEYSEVREQIMKLDQPARDAILLKYFEKMTYREIAQTLRQSENWVRNQVRKGREYIQSRVFC